MVRLPRSGNRPYSSYPLPIRDGRRALGEFGRTITADAASTHAALSSSSVRFVHYWAHMIRRAGELSTSDPMRSAQLATLCSSPWLTSRAGAASTSR
jgi:hypothetical protein